MWTKLVCSVSRSGSTGSGLHIPQSSIYDLQTVAWDLGIGNPDYTVKLSGLIYITKK